MKGTVLRTSSRLAATAVLIAAVVPGEVLAEGGREQPPAKDGDGGATGAPAAGFRCDNGRGVTVFDHCDGEDDCGDASDERGCPAGPSTQTPP